MAYTKTTWKDRLVEFSNRFTKSNETATSVTLTPDPGTITEAGTPLSAANLNKIEQGIYDAHVTADAALPASQYTATDVLAKLKTVDGAGSGLDADFIDGINSDRFIYGSDQRGTTIWTTGANNIIKSGYYYITTDYTGLPSGYAIDGYLLHHQSYNNDTYARQMFSPYNTNIMFIRVNVAGSWSSWSKYWSSNDLRWNTAGYLEYNDAGVWKPVGKVASAKYRGSYSTTSTSYVTALNVSGIGTLLFVTASGTQVGLRITIDGVVMFDGVVDSYRRPAPDSNIPGYIDTGGYLASPIMLSFKSSCVVEVKGSSGSTVTAFWAYELI